MHRVQWRLCRRIDFPQRDVAQGRISPGEEFFLENVGNPARDFPPTPPRSCHSDHEIKTYKCYATCPNHPVCPNTVASHVYAARAPLAADLPVNPCVPVWETLALLPSVVVWTVAWLQPLIKLYVRPLGYIKVRPFWIAARGLHDSVNNPQCRVIAPFKLMKYSESLSRSSPIRVRQQQAHTRVKASGSDAPCVKNHHRSRSS